MGGEIGVKSELGTGSLFWFTTVFESIDDSAAFGAGSIERTACLLLSVDDRFAKTVETHTASWSMESRRVATSADVLDALGASGERRWIAVVDVDGLSEAGAGVMVTIFQALDSGKILVVGKDGAFQKPVSQSRLFDAIVRAASVKPSDDVSRISERTHIGAGAARKRILVAEDDPRLQRLLTLQFDALGLPVTFVSDGAAAVEAVRDNDFAMVFMDCHMPKLDGLAATRAIRETERATGAHVAIAAMTANAFADDREACLAAGMDDYLAKPVRLGDLRAAVERWSTHSLARS
jgi:CheY-like chemotaxis protein